MQSKCASSLLIIMIILGRVYDSCVYFLQRFSLLFHCRYVPRSDDADNDRLPVVGFIDGISFLLFCEPNSCLDISLHCLIYSRPYNRFCVSCRVILGELSQFISGENVAHCFLFEQFFNNRGHVFTARFATCWVARLTRLPRRKI